MDKKTPGRRINFPVKSETILNNMYNEFAFDSNMTMKQHQKFNELLNSNVNPQSKVKYIHLREIDQFINVPRIGKIRRTLDEKTNEVGSNPFSFI
jgi:hypothetical protein